MKCAIQSDDIEAVKSYIDLIPLSIEYQYSYLGLSGSFEMSRYLLNTIYISWLFRINNSPHDALSSLSVGLKKLLKSFPLDQLDHGFRCMLARMRREVPNLLIGDNAELQELTHEIPEYAYEDNPEMAIAYREAFQATQQGDLLSKISKVYRATQGAVPLYAQEARY
jgi:hypothetical protein